MIRTRIGTGIVLVSAALALAGCGTTKEDRTASGALIGAGAGAAVGAVTGLSLLDGALIGTAVGGIMAYVTDPEQLNLGKPLWRTSEAVKDPQPDAHGSNAGAQTAALDASADSADSATVRSIQTGLERLGYDPGAADGVDSPKTRSAIRSYQQYYKLPVDGLPSPELAADIQRRTAAP